jgi:hypothetical protein
MWPFTSKKSPDDVENLKRELDARMKIIEGQWDDTYERFRLLYARLSKRVKQLDQAPETETAQREESGDGANHQSLSERQHELNEKILARRRRGGNGGLLHG